MMETQTDIYKMRQADRRTDRQIDRKIFRSIIYHLFHADCSVFQFVSSLLVSFCVTVTLKLMSASQYFYGMQTTFSIVFVYFKNASVHRHNPAIAAPWWIKNNQEIEKRSKRFQ